MIVWGWPIVIYLFLGGLSGGLFTTIAALDSYGLNNQFKQTIKWGANITWIFLAIGLVMLIIDLGRPERGIFTVLYPHMTSPMSLGVFILSIFLVSSLVYGISYTSFLPIEKIKFLPKIWNFIIKYRFLVAIIGGTFALLTGIYTGILLSYARFPLWCCPILPLLFLASALGTGYAIFLFIAKLTNELGNSGIEKKLHKIVILLGVIELVIVGVYLIALPSNTTNSLLDPSNNIGLIFLLIFLVGGLLLGEIGLPLIEVKKDVHIAFYFATAFSLIGGFTLRYVVVFLGPIS